MVGKNRQNLDNLNKYQGIKNWLIKRKRGVIVMALVVLAGMGAYLGNRMVKQMEIASPMDRAINLSRSNDLGQELVEIAQTSEEVVASPTDIPSVTPSIKLTSPSPTPSKKAETNNQVASITPTPRQPSPTPTLQPSITPTGVAASATPTVKTVPSNTPTVKPTNTPTNTLTPQATATPAIETLQWNADLGQKGDFAPGARGGITVLTKKNTNGYWQHTISGSFSHLMPNRNYQLWFCGINCSSNNEAKFTTDSEGRGSINNSEITHNQSGDPLKRAAVWEIPPGGEVPSDPTACFMVSMDYGPCLETGISF
jgi:hypothetical protein